MQEKTDWLQRFAEGGGAAAGGDGGAAAESAPATAGEGTAQESPAESHGADTQQAESQKDKAAAFRDMVQGEYAGEFQAAVRQAVQAAMRSAPADPRLSKLGQMEQLTKAVAAKYGVDPNDLEGLAEAINGPVKDDAYFQALAMQRGVSVETAKKMDAMETENRRMKAQREQMQRQQMRAQLEARTREVRADWDRQAQALKAKYPDFDFTQARQNPDFANLLRRGLPLETAYHAAFFDRLMGQTQASTAKQVEKGVADRIASRASRPSENGNRPGGAAVVKTDISHMTRAEREDLERRVRRGEKIEL